MLAQPGAQLAPVPSRPALRTMSPMLPYAAEVVHMNSTCTQAQANEAK